MPWVQLPSTTTKSLFLRCLQPRAPCPGKVVQSARHRSPAIDRIQFPAVAHVPIWEWPGSGRLSWEGLTVMSASVPKTGPPSHIQVPPRPANGRLRGRATISANLRRPRGFCRLLPEDGGTQNVVCKRDNEDFILSHVGTVTGSEELSV